MKKTAQWLIGIPIVILLITKVMPLIVGTLISFKDFSPITGLLNSPWAPDKGFYYYLAILNGPFFSRLLINSFIQGLIPILSSALISFILIGLLSKIQNKSLRFGLLAILALISFTPIIIFASGIVNLVTIESRFTSIVFAFLNGLPMVFISTLLGIVICERRSYTIKNVFYIVCFVAILRCITLLSSSFELIFSVYHPATYAWIDIFQAYAYRAGVFEGNYSLSCAVSNIVIIFQLLIAIGAFFIIRRIVPRLITAPTTDKDIKMQSSFRPNITAIPCFLIILLISIPVLIAVGKPLMSVILNGVSTTDIEHFSKFSLQWRLFRSFLSMLLNALFFIPASLILAYALHGGSKFYRGLLLMLIPIITIMGQFVTMHKLKLLDNTFGLALFGSISLFSVFILYLWLEVKVQGKTIKFKDYSKLSVFPLSIITISHLASSYGSYFLEMHFIISMDKMGLSSILVHQSKTALYEKLITGTSKGIHPIMIMITMIIPVLLTLSIFILLHFYNKQSKPTENPLITTEDLNLL